MTIPELRERSNRAISRVPKDVLLVAIVVLSSTASFGLGMLAGREGKGADGFWIEDVAATSTQPAAAVSAVETVVAPRIPVVSAGTEVAPAAGKYVASKNGTKYYLPSCSSANRIKAENRVWFATVEDAVAAGLSAATNCPGL